MKHLTKLVINPEKVMTDGELQLLRGGDDYWHCLVMCMINWPETNQTPFFWDGVAETDGEAKTVAEAYYEALFSLPSGFCDADECYSGGY